MKLEQAARQALECLEGVLKTGDTQVLDYTAPPAITALREALSEEDALPDDCEWVDGATPPEGERMCIQTNGETWFVKNGRYYRCTAEHKPEPIVIRTTASVTYNEGTKYAATFNADKQAEQEPVAWADDYGAVIPHSHKLFQPELLNEYTRPLYAAPVRTKDLTDDDVAKIKGFYAQASFETIVRAAIAADREKNK